MLSAYMISQISPTAVFAGLATWAYLHRCPTRGDHAMTVYFAFALSFYAAVKVSGVSSPFFLTATVLTTHGASALTFMLLYRLSPIHPLASYPGPIFWRLSSLRLVYVSLLGKRYLVLDKLHQKYGPIVRIGPDQLSVNLHSASNAIYGAGANMEKAESYNTPGHLNAIALFFKQKTKEIHTDRKRIWSQAFTSTSITNLVPALERRTWELLECIERRQSQSVEGLFDLSRAFSHWSYDFTGEMVFGGCNNLELMKTNDPEELVEGGKMATVIMDSFGQSPWLMDLIWYLPTGKSMVRLRDTAAAAMGQRVKADADTTARDLTSYLLEGQTPSGKKIPLNDLELDAVVAIQGGSDNTSTTMTLAFYYMLSSRHPYYKRLQHEIDAAFPDPIGPLDWDILANLPFLNAVIHEALRLGSPYYLPREVPAGGVSIEGRYIPGGVTVAIAAYSQQTSPENFYPEPLEFRAERWLPGGLGPDSRINKSALYSFSSGPHMCIAKSFAFQEMRYVMARLVLAYNMRLAKDFDARAFRDGILNMRTTLLQRPLLVHVQRRPGIKLPEYK